MKLVEGIVIVLVTSIMCSIIVTVICRNQAVKAGVGLYQFNHKTGDVDFIYTNNVTK